MIQANKEGEQRKLHGSCPAGKEPFAMCSKESKGPS